MYRFVRINLMQHRVTVVRGRWLRNGKKFPVQCTALAEFPLVMQRDIVRNRIQPRQRFFRHHISTFPRHNKNFSNQVVRIRREPAGEVQPDGLRMIQVKLFQPGAIPWRQQLMMSRHTWFIPRNSAVVPHCGRFFHQGIAATSVTQPQVSYVSLSVMGEYGTQTPKTWRRFVAIGDSFTEGMMDDDPAAPGSYRGWADRLAQRLANHAHEHGHDVHYANLAVRGKLVRDVTGDQLDAALAMEPDLVAMSAGGNDVLKRTANAEEVRDRLEAAAQRIRATGADVLMATGPHLQHITVLKHLNGAFGQFSANVHGICHRQQCLPIDVWSFRPLRDMRMWAPDRIHLSTLGHERIADVAAVALGLTPTNPDYLQPLPAIPESTRTEVAQETVNWTAEHLGPWLKRRFEGRSSGDGITAKRPTLARVAPNQ